MLKPPILRFEHVVKLLLTHYIIVGYTCTPIPLPASQQTIKDRIKIDATQSQILSDLVHTFFLFVKTVEATLTTMHYKSPLSHYIVK